MKKIFMFIKGLFSFDEYIINKKYVLIVKTIWKICEYRNNNL